MSGEDLPELAWTKAHLEFQLGHFENALEDYRKMLETQPNHKAQATMRPCAWKS